MGGLSKLYQRILQRHPILVQSIQTSALMGTGDAIAQTVVEGKGTKCYNRVRTAQFTTLGLLMVGPSLSVWYRFLSRIVTSNGRKAAMKKVALDQMFFAPTFIVLFLGTLGTIQGLESPQIVSNIKRDYYDIMTNNYKLWPCVQLLNFYLVPLQYQVLVVQTVALFWNTYISWKTQKHQAC